MYEKGWRWHKDYGGVRYSASSDAPHLIVDKEGSATWSADLMEIRRQL